MTPADVRRMVGMIRAIRAGKWAAELPAWGARHLTAISFDDDQDATSELRAVQTAEAFILLAHSSDMAFDEPRFLKDCGFSG